MPEGLINEFEVSQRRDALCWNRFKKWLKRQRDTEGYADELDNWVEIIDLKERVSKIEKAVCKCLLKKSILSRN